MITATPESGTVAAATFCDSRKIAQLLSEGCGLNGSVVGQLHDVKGEVAFAPSARRQSAMSAGNSFR